MIKKVWERNIEKRNVGRRGWGRMWERDNVDVLNNDGGWECEIEWERIKMGEGIKKYEDVRGIEGG